MRGIYRSTDYGDSWEDSSEGLTPKQRHYYTDLVFSPKFAEDQTIWLFGHKTGLGRTEAFGGYWESIDGGRTWIEIDYQGFPLRELAQRVSQDIIGVVISPNIADDGTMIAAAGGEGVYISKDKGRNWELLNPVKDVFDIHAPPTFPDEPFLALSTTGSQVMISTDGGETFATSSEGLPENMNAVRGVAFSGNFAEDRRMFCFGAPGVFVSEDAGESWQPLALAEDLASVNAMDVSGDFVEYGAIVYGTDDAKVYLSDDMGQTFASLEAESLLSYGVETVAFPPDYQVSRQVFIASQDGMFRYGPALDEAAEAAAQAHVENVEATRVARATAVAGMEFVAEESDRVETGCIAYLFLPAILLLFYLLRHR
ncbi:MAG: WD40/YVTN/BNR-like repeat-containing protein [Anaerolineae bacterium]